MNIKQNDQQLNCHCRNGFTFIPDQKGVNLRQQVSIYERCYFVGSGVKYCTVIYVIIIHEKGNKIQHKLYTIEFNILMI